jgi:putative membrane protein
LVLLALTVVGLVVSAVGAHDAVTWWLEAGPVVAAIPLLVATYRRFPLTPLAYRLIFVHAAILMLGAHYTYARVPLGHWAQETFGWARNHYDRLGHLAQGFIPASLAREGFVRRVPLRPGGWLFFLVLSFALGFSAFYELIEWWAALIGGGAADSFLGTQGDVWDTQWDMFLALIGALSAQLLLARHHDRQLAAVSGGGEG